MLQQLLKKCGIYYAKRRYMPVGFDWLHDVQRLRPSGVDCVLDVGANEGQTALAVTQYFRNARIHSFEPVTHTYERLVNNVRGHANISCHQHALGAVRGTATMAVGTNSLVNRLASDAMPVCAGQTAEIVNIETIDSFCGQQGIGRVGILKIDVEGAEQRVIEGASRMLSDGRIDFAFVEIGFCARDPGHSYAADVMRQLDESGLGLFALYDYCRLMPPQYVQEEMLPVFANALFARR